MIRRHNKTIIIIRDNYPGYNFEESQYIEHVLVKAGYFVRPVSIKEFCSERNVYHFQSFMLIVPQCNNLPIETIDMLRRYNYSNGSVLFLNGPLYYHRIESRDDGTFENIPLVNTMDASFTDRAPYVREGIAPSYKTYNTKNITKIQAVDNHGIFKGELKLPYPVNVNIPCQTGNGGGYVKDSVSRFIPLVDCYDDNSDSTDVLERGRCGGSRGAFAFIELQRTMGFGYEGKNDHGMVYGTALGSAAAMIGVEKCPLQEIEGSDKLLLAIADKFNHGIYLLNGGADGLCYRRGESMTVGAEVTNTTIDFVETRVEIDVETEKDTLHFEAKKLVGVRATADVHFAISAEELESFGLVEHKDYAISTRLFVDGELIDEITSTYMMEYPVPVTDKTKFVSVKDDYFVIGDTPWYLAGINYWSTWNPAIERPQYWLGQFDRVNYSQKNVEDDLKYMDKIGLNCLLVRVDFTDIDRSVHGIRDFLVRCKRHNIRVMLAFVKATASKFYSPKAVEEIFDKIFISGNPTVFAIDIEWETHDDQIHFPSTSEEFDDEWQEWLENKYGSVEKAEEYYGVKMERDLYGYVKYPPFDRKTGADIRRFACDSVNEYWSRLIPHIKPYLPNQLITFRHGGICTDGPGQAIDYIDFVPLEAYMFYGFEKDIEKPENHMGSVGMISCGSLIQKYEAGGKPVIWAEYGYSMCGTKGIGVEYDHTNRTYLPEKIKFQTIFNDCMCEAMEDAHCAGSAPWWWCGGFRSTEMSDFGYMMPDGLLSLSGRNYVKFCEKMKAKAGMPDTREPYTFEGNVFDFPDGKYEFIRTACIPEYRKARAEGKRFVIKTKYED